MVEFMKVAGLMIRNKVMELKFFRMATAMKVIMLTANLKAKVFINGLMVNCTMVNGMKGKKMDQVDYY